jgi:hypothetical protein
LAFVPPTTFLVRIVRSSPSALTPWLPAEIAAGIRWCLGLLCNAQAHLLGNRH